MENVFFSYMQYSYTFLKFLLLIPIITDRMNNGYSVTENEHRFVIVRSMYDFNRIAKYNVKTVFRLKFSITVSKK